MQNTFIDKNKKNVNILIGFFIVFSLLSFLVITNTYSKIQNNINNTSISNLIYKIKSKIDYNHKIGLVYSSSNELYQFIENSNKNYIDKNFPKDSNSLKDLDLSYIILTDKKNAIKYSNFTEAVETSEIKNFTSFILNKFNNISNTNKIIIYKNQAYYIYKIPVYRTTTKNNSNGFLYLGSKINKNKIKDLSQNFTNIKFISNLKNKANKNTQNNNKIMPFEIKIKSEKINNQYINEISFYDYTSNISFIIKAEKEINILNEIRNNTLIIFLLLVLLAILSLLYIHDKYKKTLENKTSNFKLEMQELKERNKILHKIAHTDYLTNTMNRRNFFINAQINFTQAQKNKELICVVMIDIDNFKKFNDNYGHSVGDKILILFANSIKNNITEKTILGRLGGEEFALVIQNTNLEGAIKKAEKLKQKIEEIELEVNGEMLKITASFGVSDNQNCHNIDEMLQKADKLLYTAKQSGRNLVRSRLNFC